MAAQTQVFQILNVHHIPPLKQFFMTGQIFIPDRIQSHYIKSNALVPPLYDKIQNLIIHAGVLSKITTGSPVLIPSGIKQKKIRLFCFLSIPQDLFHRDSFPLL